MTIMAIATPHNSAEASYIAVTAIDKLIELLVEKGIITRDDATGLLQSIIQGLTHSKSGEGKRAAQFLAGRID